MTSTAAGTELNRMQLRQIRRTGQSETVSNRGRTAGSVAGQSRQQVTRPWDVPRPIIKSKNNHKPNKLCRARIGTRGTLVTYYKKQHGCKDRSRKLTAKLLLKDKAKDTEPDTASKEEEEEEEEEEEDKEDKEDKDNK
ncbi:hypothetical protein K504DRAFT_524239 [Pleomassaria siparia CBS 279.74]|uniref:Uncharacterized protein n=1 Tax=Pleomassaria siparia CBS 279.74 TaxID=1314801 RepID=A0A6G1KE23_9PLEO|nr:hypothetical protein K504DRAFT_524239 [Pleomassaria siparia CBS 279.74]